jgi:hypothetical protein
MGHCVHAFLGSRPALELIVERFPHSAVIDLPHQLALLPLTGDLYDALPSTPENPVRSTAPFVHLTPKVTSLLRSVSDARGLIYFETDYAGGHGTQGAMVARGGELVFGPVSGPGTINAALRLLGVRSASGKVDEFATLGLDDCRHTEDWLERAGSTESF